MHELESHVSIPADRITVTVQSGWVTLEELSIGNTRRLLPVAIRNLKGVIGVTNNIEVKLPVTPTE